MIKLCMHYGSIAFFRPPLQSSMCRLGRFAYPFVDFNSREQEGISRDLTKRVRMALGKWHKVPVFGLIFWILYALNLPHMLSACTKCSETIAPSLSKRRAYLVVLRGHNRLSLSSTSWLSIATRALGNFGMHVSETILDVRRVRLC